FEDLALDAHFTRFLVDIHIARAGYATLAHAARDDGSVTGHAAARGENALSDFHAVNIFGSGFAAHENDGDILAMSGLGDRIVGGENDLADGSARRCRETLGQNFDLASLLVEPRNEEVVQLVRIDAE